MKKNIGVLVIIVGIVLCIGFIESSGKNNGSKPSINIEEIKKENGRLLSKNKISEKENQELVDYTGSINKHTGYMFEQQCNHVRYEIEKTFYSLMNYIKNGEIDKAKGLFVDDVLIENGKIFFEYYGQMRTFTVEPDMYYFASYYGTDNGTEYNISYQPLKKAGEDKGNMDINGNPISDENNKMINLCFRKTEQGWKIVSIIQGLYS